MSCSLVTAELSGSGCHGACCHPSVLHQHLQSRGLRGGRGFGGDLRALMITVRLCTAALGVTPPTTLPPEEASPGCNLHSPSDQQLPLQSDTGRGSRERGQPGKHDFGLAWMSTVCSWWAVGDSPALTDFAPHH